jgi:peptidoglycan/LPS O-acetylase OafA/YrhL
MRYQPTATLPFSGSKDLGLIRPVMPELDTIRGVAVVGVLFLHGFAWQYGGFQFGKVATLFLRTTELGSLGVNLFFVLSGFLITGILVDTRQAPRFYARFYTRRALRILPLYYALLILLWLLHSSSGAFVGLSFIYLANLTNFFGVGCDYAPCGRWLSRSIFTSFGRPLCATLAPPNYSQLRWGLSYWCRRCDSSAFSKVGEAAVLAGTHGLSLTVWPLEAF